MQQLLYLAMYVLGLYAQFFTYYAIEYVVLKKITHYAQYYAHS